MALTDRNAAYDLSLFEEDEVQELAKAESQKNIVYNLEEERKKRAKAKPKINPLTAFLATAVSALVILVGMDCGQTEGSDRAGKSACYKVVRELLAQSERENGSLICAEILGLKGEKVHCSYVASERTQEYYKTRPCAAKVESAARIFASYLSGKEVY